MITSEQIKSLAASFGFDACGIVGIDVGAGSPRPGTKGEETSPLQQAIADSVLTVGFTRRS